MTRKTPKAKRFEEALADLEKIVDRLESGELPLEESLAAFEEGVHLVRYCNQKLNEVEKKIQLLVKNGEGKMQLKNLTDLPKERSDGEE